MIILLKNFLFFSLIIGGVQFSQAQKKADLAQHPPMGWNSWNWFGKHDINEKIVVQVIDAMVDEGLRDAGYTYVVIDGGWRDAKLGESGELLSHPVKFPNGIKPLADYAHQRGMKLGVHVVPGTHDCGGDPVGAVGLEEVHLNQFMDWGLDFIKLDQCRFVDDPCQDCPQTKLGWSEPNAREIYTKWGELFAEANREILFSISAYTYRPWYPSVCHMARTTLDIQCRIHKGGGFFTTPNDQKMAHKSVMHIAEKNNQYAEFARAGYWNDPDMLILGDHGLSQDEQESHYGLWVIMTSPLMLGNNPLLMSDFEKKLILNRDAIAINQDETEQGRKIKETEYTQVWVKKLKGGNIAVLLLNLDETNARQVDFEFKELNFSDKMNVKEVFSERSLGKHKKVSANLNTNQSKLYLITK